MIVSAAAKLIFSPHPGDWTVIPLHRHRDCGTILSELQVETWDCEEGFLTDKGDFLDRQMALQHAVDCGQVDPESPEGQDIIRSGVLMSEDLW